MEAEFAALRAALLDIGDAINMTAHEGNHSINPLTNKDYSGQDGGAYKVGNDCQAAVDNTLLTTGSGGEQLRQRTMHGSSP